MRKLSGILIIFTLLGLTAASGQAASDMFSVKELFRVPFGDAREALGSKAENGQFTYPKNFTLDGAGRVYIYDLNKHRVARFSADGKYEIGFAYPATARQVFAHADSKDNVWLLVSDPGRGLFYGVYDSRGKSLREGLFSQFNQFRLHLDDASGLHIILSSDKHPSPPQTYIFEETSLRMKKENIAPPPESHHALRKDDRTYFIDSLPGTPQGAVTVNRITDPEHHGIAEIQGAVVYMTNEGDIYTRVGDCEIRVYDVHGLQKDAVMLTGLRSACESIRFDPEGNIYQLDGIPDASHQYTPQMTGMRLLKWARK